MAVASGPLMGASPFAGFYATPPGTPGGPAPAPGGGREMPVAGGIWSTFYTHVTGPDGAIYTPGGSMLRPAGFTGDAAAVSAAARAAAAEFAAATAAAESAAAASAISSEVAGATMAPGFRNNRVVPNPGSFITPAQAAAQAARQPPVQATMNAPFGTPVPSLDPSEIIVPGFTQPAPAGTPTFGHHAVSPNVSGPPATWTNVPATNAFNTPASQIPGPNSPAPGTADNFYSWRPETTRPGVRTYRVDPAAPLGQVPTDPSLIPRSSRPAVPVIIPTPPGVTLPLTRPQPPPTPVTSQPTPTASPPAGMRLSEGVGVGLAAAEAAPSLVGYLGARLYELNNGLPFESFQPHESESPTWGTMLGISQPGVQRGYSMLAWVQRMEDYRQYLQMQTDLANSPLSNFPLGVSTANRLSDAAATPVPPGLPYRPPSIPGVSVPPDPGWTVPQNLVPPSGLASGNEAVEQFLGNLWATAPSWTVPTLPGQAPSPSAPPSAPGQAPPGVPTVVVVEL